MWERIDTGIYKQIYKGSEIMIICNWRTWHVWIDGEMIDITFSTLGRAKEFVHAVQLISESVQFKH